MEDMLNNITSRFLIGKHGSQKLQGRLSTKNSISNKISFKIKKKLIHSKINKKLRDFAACIPSLKDIVKLETSIPYFQ